MMNDNYLLENSLDEHPEDIENRFRLKTLFPDTNATQRQHGRVQPTK
jgi:hypothetical protein